MSGNGHMINNMDMGKNFGQMEQALMETISMERRTVKECTRLQMVHYIRETLLTILSMALENTFGLMATAIRGTGRIIR